MSSPPLLGEGGSDNLCITCGPSTEELVLCIDFQSSQPGSQLTQFDESSSALVPFASRAVAAHGGTLTGSKRASSPTPPASSVCTSVSSPRGKRNKRCKIAPPARSELCCYCSASSTCSERNCPCAIARRPCRPNCGPTESNKCNNSCSAINERLTHLNHVTRRGPASKRMRAFINLPSSPPLHQTI